MVEWVGDNAWCAWEGGQGVEDCIMTEPGERDSELGRGDKMGVAGY